jgi:hypothetical protein
MRGRDFACRAPGPAVAPRRQAVSAAVGALGAACLALAAGMSALSVLGPLVTGLVHWRITPLVNDQLLGLDAVSLVVVAPLAAVAGLLTRRGAALGPVLGFGPAMYAAYMVPQYVLGPDYLRTAGNNERAFPLLLGLLVLGVGIACRLGARWTSIASRRPRPGSDSSDG